MRRGRLLWRQLGLSPDVRDGWSEPVRWASDLMGRAHLASSSEVRRWPQHSMRSAAAAAGRRGVHWATFPFGFPSSPPGDDRGWHIDANTPLPDGSWAVTGRPHTVLLLTLLSEVGPDDAPTRIRVGSHRDVARVLGPDPVELAEMGRLVDEASAERAVAYATGEPGDMFVVHPFTAHAADEHRGRTPRFMAQAPVVLTAPLTPASSSPLACVWENR